MVGREEEIKVLTNLLSAKEADLLVVYGRRRVGKTFLIRNTYSNEMAFEYAGIHEAPLAVQLAEFTTTLNRFAGSYKWATPKTWTEAFQFLKDYLTPLLKRKKRVIFFDEFPWIDTPRSFFLAAFEHFWNTWASVQPNLVVVICGSSASWMIKKVINNRGGLHNRVTKKLRLLPFTLSETEEFLKSRHINLSRYQILQLYMVTGGIPQYLKEVQVGESATQAIDRLCFTNDGFLRTEFSNLYSSLFDNYERYVKIIRALASKPRGLSRKELISACGLNSGGGTTAMLEALTESGFILSYLPLKRNSKDAIFKLSDEYSLFYLQFVANSRATGEGTWAKLSTKPSYTAWSGYAFERICLKHTRQIKGALGIESVYTEESVWHNQAKGETQGTQIDLLIDRRDGIINLCEIKFTTDSYTLTKTYAQTLEQKVRIFTSLSGTKKTVFLTFISTYGLKNKEQLAGLIQSEITMDALFRK
jgi:AAA+ ATPase superfamily predicted ATPase